MNQPRLFDLPEKPPSPVVKRQWVLFYVDTVTFQKRYYRVFKGRYGGLFREWFVPSDHPRRLPRRYQHYGFACAMAKKFNDLRKDENIVVRVEEWKP